MKRGSESRAGHLCFFDVAYSVGYLYLYHVQVNKREEGLRRKILAVACLAWCRPGFYRCSKRQSAPADVRVSIPPPPTQSPTISGHFPGVRLMFTVCKTDKITSSTPLRLFGPNLRVFLTSVCLFSARLIFADSPPNLCNSLV